MTDLEKIKKEIKLIDENIDLVQNTNFENVRLFKVGNYDLDYFKGLEKELIVRYSIQSLLVTTRKYYMNQSLLTHIKKYGIVEAVKIRKQHKKLMKQFLTLINIKEEMDLNDTIIEIK